MPSLNLRFQKFDKFNNVIFIANPLKESKVFNQLTKYCDKLKNADYDTFLPIYSNAEMKYATIRFRYNGKVKFEKNDVYDIDFSIKKKDRDDKTYVNCYINTCKLVSKAPPIDEGEEIDFSDD
jgi:hypothetical protein